MNAATVEKQIKREAFVVVIFDVGGGPEVCSTLEDIFYKLTSK